MSTRRPEGEDREGHRRRELPRSDDADVVREEQEGERLTAQEHGGPHRNPRTGETPSERRTRQINELLQETRVVAVGVQVLIGFLLAIPFNAELTGLQRDAYVVALLAAVAATGLLLAPSVVHRALLHQGQAVWIVNVGTRLILLGVAATAVALVAASLLVGDRLFDGVWRWIPPIWATIVLTAFWAVLPGQRLWRLVAQEARRSDPSGR